MSAAAISLLRDFMTGRRCRRRTALVLGAVWVGLAADVAAQGSAATDRAALEAIYRTTGGDDWTNNTNWLSNAPPENWYGVEVTDGRVTGLRLGGWDETARKHVGNGLTGSLPAELGTLSQLRRVEIGGNSGLGGVSTRYARPPRCSGPSGDTPPAPRLGWQLWALRPGLDGTSRPSTTLTGTPRTRRIGERAGPEPPSRGCSRYRPRNRRCGSTYAVSSGVSFQCRQGVSMTSTAL